MVESRVLRVLSLSLLYSPFCLKDDLDHAFMEFSLVDVLRSIFP